MKTTHKMRYTSGGGTQYDGGEWSIKETDKTITFSCTKVPFYESHFPQKTRISKSKERKHSFTDWEDGTYTVYPFQSGTPHYFEPIKTP